MDHLTKFCTTENEASFILFFSIFYFFNTLFCFYYCNKKICTECNSERPHLFASSLRFAVFLNIFFYYLIVALIGLLVHNFTASKRF